jgi:hypothetical protein
MFLLRAVRRVGRDLHFCSFVVGSSDSSSVQQTAFRGHAQLSLAADSAIVVGLAASRVPPRIRRQAIIWGISGAVALRLVFAGVVTELFSIIGLTFAGGLILLWVCFP